MPPVPALVLDRPKHGKQVVGFLGSGRTRRPLALEKPNVMPATEYS